LAQSSSSFCGFHWRTLTQYGLAHHRVFSG